MYGKLYFLIEELYKNILLKLYKYNLEYSPIEL